MKKFFVVITVFLSVLILCLTACANDGNGTYFPNSSEMKTNLESGAYLSAEKGNDFIEFYWLDDPDDCAYFYNLLEENHTDYNSLVQIKDDEKFGSIVYCGTENAVNAAGIKVVKVKV